MCFWSQCVEDGSYQYVIWHLSTGLVSVGLQAAPNCSYWGAWSPACHAVLVGARHDTSVTLVSSQGELMAPPQQVGLCDSGCWGHDHIALEVQADQAAPWQLRLYTLVGLDLVWHHSVAAPHLSVHIGLTSKSFSPDGAHLAVLIQLGIAFVRCSDGAVFEIAWDYTPANDSDGLSFCWAADNLVVASVREEWNCGTSFFLFE